MTYYNIGYYSDDDVEGMLDEWIEHYQADSSIKALLETVPFTFDEVQSEYRKRENEKDALT